MLANEAAPFNAEVIGTRLHCRRYLGRKPGDGSLRPSRKLPLWRPCEEEGNGRT